MNGAEASSGSSRPTPAPALVAAERIEFESFARVCDIHPELLARLVDLGLVRVESDEQGRLWVARHEVRAVARVRRLRSGLGLNYSAIAVVADLIDRIDALESTLRWYRANSGLRAPGEDPGTRVAPSNEADRSNP
ncbi:MAG: chaperone modulator CbpM [Microthrixaceae bacterium]